MNPLISVIVPIFNVEKYLNRCVDSIINQTYENLEIILVDDGSTDGCPGICDDYAKKDSRIKVIHKENGGLSDARNAGMKVAIGEYISFVDSDDYVIPDFIEKMLSILISERSDIAECNVAKFYEDGSRELLCENEEVNSYSTSQGLSGLIAENPFKQHVWNKLYKADIALSTLFPKGKLNEDEFWTYRIFGKAEKVTKINKTMYCYFQRNGSIMGNKYSIRRLDALEAKAERQKYIESQFPELAQQAKIDFFESCLFAGQSSEKFLYGSERTKARKIIKRYLKTSGITFADIRTAESSLGKWLYFAKISFNLCCKLRAITGIGF